MSAPGKIYDFLLLKVRSRGDDELNPRPLLFQREGECTQINVFRKARMRD